MFFLKKSTWATQYKGVLVIKGWYFRYFIWYKEVHVLNKSLVYFPWLRGLIVLWDMLNLCVLVSYSASDIVSNFARVANFWSKWSLIGTTKREWGNSICDQRFPIGNPIMWNEFILLRHHDYRQLTRVFLKNIKSILLPGGGCTHCGCPHWKKSDRRYANTNNIFRNVSNRYASSQSKKK